MVAADAQRCYHIIRVLQYLTHIRRFRYNQILVISVYHMAAQLCDDLLFLLIDVIERYLVNMKCLVSCQQAVDKNDGSDASSPDNCDFHFVSSPFFFP